jgi:DNA-binding winged helix-turn-helix (wHTH) protein/tetratricopeptide (TPR) repeat protein
MAAEILHFDDFELDRGAYELRHAGQTVHLERIPLDLLFLLVDRRGRLVTRAEIVERIWGKGVFIDIDNGINGAVRKLRRALNDNPGEPRFIGVIHGRGYRFLATVREAGGGSTPMRPTLTSVAGRQREIAELRAGLEDAKAGRGRLFLISGGPGIGKTRLAQELTTLAQANRMVVLAGRCSDRVEAVPFLPFVEILESCVDTAHPNRLERLLGAEASDLARMLPKLRRILPDLPAPLELPPEQARRHLLNCFCDFAGRIAGQQPALMILDDLHWADDSALALLGHLTQRLPNLPLMVLGTYRDVELDVTGAFAKTLEELIRGRLATAIRLRELVQDEIAQMLTSLSGLAPPAKVVSEFYDETRGNPFFVEELFLYLTEENRLYDAQGAFRPELRIAELEVPQSVRLVVGRRVARLSEPTQRMLDTAAVIGRSFTLKLLEGATAFESLPARVEEAERAGLIFSGANSPKFEFSHEIIRQAVISGLTVARRQILHERVAQTLESMFAGQLDDYVAELAYHYGRGDNVEKAVEYFGAAGESASRRFAYREAETHFRSALGIIEKIPAAPQRDQREMHVLQGLHHAVNAIHGIGFAEMPAILGRLGELCRRLARVAELAEVLQSHAMHYTYAGDMDQAAALCEQALAVATQVNDAGRIELARNSLGIVHYWTGAFASSHDELEPTLQRDLRAGDPYLGFASTVALMRSRDLWMLGFPDQAREQSRKAIELAARMDDPLMLAQAKAFGADVHYYCGEVDEVDRRALEVRGFLGTAESSNPQLIGWTAMLEGWVMGQRGQTEEAVNRVRDGYGVILASRNRVAMPLFDCVMANAQAAAGRPLEALETLEAASQAAEQTGQHYSDSELRRLRGEFLLLAGSQKVRAAEECFHQSLDIAQRQQAKSWQLRATISLTRLLTKLKRRAEARKKLEEICGWFTEGFDTADLKEARALLHQLRRNSFPSA